MAYIDETGLAEVTTKLKTYIDNKAGGGSAPTNISELDAVIKTYYNSLKTGTVQPYTQNAITLYTPDSNFRYYFIRKRSDGEIYNIVWLKQQYSTIYGTISGLTNLGISTIGGGFKNVGKLILNNENLDSNTVSTTLAPVGANQLISVYLSPNYNTPADAIAAIQDPTTAYTGYLSDNLGGFATDETYFGYTNLEYYCRKENNEYVELKRLSPLSENEAIEVIQ